MMPATQTICAECGYDLAGLTGGPCPECGAEFTDTDGLSARAARWTSNPWRWLGIPVALHATVVLAWFLVFTAALNARSYGPVWPSGPWVWPNIGELLGAIVTFTAMFLVVFLPTFGAHAVGWSLTKDSPEYDRFRGFLWWFTLPAVYAACLVGPAVVVVEGLMFKSDYSANQAMLVYTPLLAPWIWRAGWSVGRRVTGISLRPRVSHWVIACGLGMLATLLATWWLTFVVDILRH
jgi:hypothetical protein